ncbi:mast cell protease 8-like [Cricetulus griseus]|uniref:Mast cell protease 8 n=1 Tax=Cricetulus griseus TaxID=10029 RepID=A0A8C2QMM4_CRIGR|nr:mast cell protease 8-like [Cricetulus griseus]XP_027245858.1 mast cell protease 8-like [Cricetulus griseus]
MFLLLSLLVAVLPVSTEGGEIMWGTEAKPHSHPYMAFIRYYDIKSNLKRCGGFLVEKDVVITAAQCGGRNISVTLGVHNIKELKNTQPIPVLKVIRHEDYNSEKMVNDIMLLKLKHKAQLNKAVKTIALPKSQEWVKPKQVCTVAGWGKLAGCTLPDKLQEVKLEVQESDVCRKMYKSYDNSTQLCVGNPKEKKATADGDFGGPFVCNGVAQGIVSQHHCTGDLPEVFTRISSFIPWIQKKMKLLQQP